MKLDILKHRDADGGGLALHYDSTGSRFHDEIAKELVEGPATLPDPGVDVYIQRHFGDKWELARLNPGGKYFQLATFFSENNSRHKFSAVSVRGIKRWDYAVPAGDLL